LLCSEEEIFTPSSKFKAHASKRVASAPNLENKSFWMLKQKKRKQDAKEYWYGLRRRRELKRRLFFVF